MPVHGFPDDHTFWRKQIPGLVAAGFRVIAPDNGNYDLVNLQASVSAPILNGKAGVRLPGAWRDRDGFVHNAAGGESNDRHRYIVRGQLYFEPNAELSVRIIGDYSKSDEKCCDAIVVRDSSYAAAGLFAVSGLPANGGVSISGQPTLSDYRTSNDRELSGEIKQWGVSAQLDYDFGGAQLTAITGYRDSRAASVQESDFVALNVFSTSNTGSTATGTAARAFTKLKTFTQELRIPGSTLNDKFVYLVGAYYADERINEIQSMTLGSQHQAYISSALTSVGVPGPNPALNIFVGGVSSAGSFANNNFRQNARNIPVFTNNTFHLSDAVGLNFGLRYSDDRKKGSFDQLSAS